MIQSRVASPPPVPSPPLLLPSTYHRSDIPKTDMPFRKRLCLNALAFSAMTAVEEVNERVTILATTQRPDTHELYVHDEDTQDDRALMREDRSMALKASIMTLEAQVRTLQTHHNRIEWQRQDAGDLVTTAFGRIHALEARDRARTRDAEHQYGPADVGSSFVYFTKMPPKKTTTPMSNAAFKALIAQGVADALAEPGIKYPCVSPYHGPRPVLLDTIGRGGSELGSELTSLAGSELGSELTFFVGSELGLMNSKFVDNILPEWSRFVTAVKLNRGLRDSNYDQLYAYLKQHEDLALNVDNVFQANDCDAFDSNVDEAPTAQTMFMANLSSIDPVYDEAGSSYDSDVLSEVHDHGHYQDAGCKHHEVYEIHDDVQPNYVVDSHNGYTSDSNRIPYD
uniref:Integrase, catalytic region, zinc finger, CCHC-type, peptidase aspartic, catalytic n=1 Tax=Tanacetum cinerariifolium TaxID=118510 RepID=A0A6L2LM19_TANCI|nr:integrase, catalytic region, zinc finger, CCHC-type, peptidase aspartic, catalytic [Tanacetum cinerariifolium]